MLEKNYDPFSISCNLHSCIISSDSIPVILNINCISNQVFDYFPFLNCIALFAANRLVMNCLKERATSLSNLSDSSGNLINSLTSLLAVLVNPIVDGTPCSR